MRELTALGKCLPKKVLPLRLVCIEVPLNTQTTQNTLNTPLSQSQFGFSVKDRPCDKKGRFPVPKGEGYREGLYVQQVKEGSPAARAGLLVGHRVLEVNNLPVCTFSLEQFLDVLATALKPQSQREQEHRAAEREAVRGSAEPQQKYSGPFWPQSRSVVPAGRVLLLVTSKRTEDFYATRLQNGSYRLSHSLCEQLGRSDVIERWDSNKRVAIMGSGGLSHQIIDENLDRMVLKALQDGNAEALASISIEDLNRAPGTPEILNWVVCAGSAEPTTMTLLDYLPCYRSMAGTGHGNTFGYWK